MQLNGSMIKQRKAGQCIAGQKDITELPRTQLYIAGNLHKASISSVTV